MSELSEEELQEKLERLRISLIEASARRAKPYAKVSIDIKQAACINIPSSSSSVSSMANNRTTLKKLASPVHDQIPLCIEYPRLNADFELKSEIIHLLPTFHGFVGEDPNHH
ncbi:hypothetical protein PanWU01x14_266200 [Parasponia andersonii]|uniref:Uncharacterized protein n=1 Tax=Parasponia andersonii TaxID=3476 RepID=A0A2P5B6W3_PARAD|nr:hypothetical protein PanWU01x14_266200 [Parasponia andersonii]